VHASLAAGRTLLAPTAELAAALFDAVERSNRTAGLTVWPTPRIRDFTSWLREHRLRRQATDPGALGVLSEVEERELWRRVVLDGDGAGGLLEPGGAADAARHARRLMADHGIPLAALEAYGGEEANALLAWSREFERRCADLGVAGPAALLDALREPPETIAWVESPGWNPVARRWLAAHGGEPLQAPAASAPQNRAVVEPLLHADTAAEEFAAIAAWARARLAQNPGFRAWISVADLGERRAELLDAFDAELAPQRFTQAHEGGVAAYAVAGGTPLAAFAPVRIALETLRVTSGVVPFERFSAVLRAADYHSSPQDASSAARLDGALRERAPHALDFGAWLGLAERIASEFGVAPPSAIARLRDMAGRLAQVRGPAALSRWAATWIDAFERGPWALRQRWSSAEFQAAERLRELLGTLASADRVLGSQSRANAERLLATAARDTAFQPQTGIAPIWISGARTDPWLTYDGLWLSGMTETRWPPPAEPVPLLPVALQRRFDVRPASAALQLAHARDLQSRWVLRAPELRASYANSQTAGRTAASPLLRTSLVEVAVPADVTVPHWRHALREGPALEELDDERAPPFADPERTHGVATLKAQSRCAFRGFAETRLSSDSLSLPTPGFSPSERGNLVHQALEHIWSALGSSAELAAIDPARQAELIAQSVAGALERVCARRDPGGRWRERERVRLAALLPRWLDVERQRAPFVIERLEPGRQLAYHAGLEFACRVDRIDRLEDGARVLIDYKTGAAATDWRGDRPDNPQLPVYALLYRERLVAVAYGRVNATHLDFTAESERAGVFRAGARVTALEGAPSFGALLDVWAARIERLAADFADGVAAVAPTLEACTHCHLQGVCRVPTNRDDGPTTHRDDAP